MPVTKTAKRALRSSKKKEKFNKALISKLEAAIREAENKPSKKTVKAAVSLVDKASKKKIIHKNKAARLKSRLDKLISKKPPSSKSKTKKKK